jgi:hypothetical protein
MPRRCWPVTASGRKFSGCRLSKSPRYWLLKPIKGSNCGRIRRLPALFRPGRFGKLNGEFVKRQQLEHILRAAGAITGAECFVVIGSQAILGQFADPPADLLVSIEADLFSLRNPEDADLIDGSIGEASPFHQTFGYYAHGVGEKTAVLPMGSKDRLIPLASPATGGATGLCLEVHDLAVSKLVAGREKDIQFVAALFRYGLAKPPTVGGRLADTPLSEALQEACKARVQKALELAKNS